MPSAKQLFVDKVRKHLAEYGMELSFSDGAFVKAEGAKCFGYFDEQKIAIAKGHNRWVEVLAHEYSHFLQWLAGSETYVKCFGPKNYYSTICDEWLNGKKHKAFMVKRAFDALRAMERECEMIAVKVMRDNDLGVDIERYTQEANCYIYIHHLMEARRMGWDKFKEDPFEARYIRKMPSSFRHKSHKKIPADIRKLFEDIC